MTIVERWTTADLAHFPDDDGLRYEIINGELHVSKAPNWYHQAVAERIARALGNWNDEVGDGQVVSTPGVILDDDDNLIPDVIWISNERFATALWPDGKLHELPELIVEILSPGPANVRLDREDKLDVYARHAVQEYWIVDWPQRTIEVYRRDNDTLRLVETLGENDVLRTALLPAFAFPLAPLFVGVPGNQ